MHSDLLADLLTVLPSSRASIWHMLQCGKVRRPSEMRKNKKKHNQGGVWRREKRKSRTFFWHSSCTCDAVPADLWLRCTSLMKDLLVLRSGEAAGFRKPKLFRGTRATVERRLTRVPETPPGCQVDLFFNVESDKTRLFRTKVTILETCFISVPLVLLITLY